MIKKEKIMNKKEILNYLELINDELTDAYHLSDTPETVNALSSIDTAQDLLLELTNNINDELMGPDGLPLNFPYHINDGEGRLKGNN